MTENEDNETLPYLLDTLQPLVRPDMLFSTFRLEAHHSPEGMEEILKEQLNRFVDEDTIGVCSATKMGVLQCSPQKK